MHKINWTKVDDYLKKGYQLIDIREPFEIEQTSLVANAKNISLTEIVANPEILDRSQKYLIYCQSSNRSNDLIKQLIEIFKYDENNLIDIEGGWIKYKLINS